MKTKSSLRGFSVVTILIIIVVLAGLGVGGYFAYTNYVAPMLNPYAKLIPEGLKAYDLGKNADGFFVYNYDKDLESIFSQIPGYKAGDVPKAAIGYYSSTQASGVIAVQFDTKERAQFFTSSLQSQIPKSGGLSPIPSIDVQQKDNIMLISLGKGLQAFQGSLADNQEIKNIDPKMLDSQLIVYLNHDNSPETTLILFSIINTIGYGSFMSNETYTKIPTAHAQGLINPGDPGRISEATGGQGSPRALAITMINGILPFAKNSTIIVRYKNQILNAQITTNIVTKDELPKSRAIKLIQQLNGIADINQINQAYDSIIDLMKKSISAIQDEFNKIKQSLSTSDATISFENNSLRINLSISEKDLNYILLPQKLGAPQKARDAARKADLNNIIAAIETYNMDNNKYPQTSGCLESITELNQYFMNNSLPKDPQGAQTYGNITCTSGYYYQIIPNKEYDLWTKMETPTSGNIDVSPDVYATNPDIYKPVMKTETSTTSTGAVITTTSPANQPSGAYYFISRGITVEPASIDTNATPISDGSPSLEVTQQTTPNKVRRVAN